MPPLLNTLPTHMVYRVPPHGALGVPHDVPSAPHTVQRVPHMVPRVLLTDAINRRYLILPTYLCIFLLRILRIHHLHHRLLLHLRNETCWGLHTFHDVIYQMTSRQ
ncbi:hypothetical protein HOLleu_35658 [Holothuria leucospilota]|uniref:Uncharacterized protein n=1 Tax=Holothuria leucospilota TaxID=206669 RepID=A0A9Q0YIT0_HOLLE|nr:hypothetical protein HOLleu_35658 [Holothuria leucospilota]